MAQTISTAAVNSRVNRRFLLLAIILAILSAVLVYAQMSRSGSNEGGSAGSVSVVVAKGAIAAGTRITADMLEVRDVTQDNVGFQALSNTEQAVGQVARYPIAAGEQVLSSKLVDTTISSSSNLAYVLESGTRGRIPDKETALILLHALLELEPYVPRYPARREEMVEAPAPVPPAPVEEEEPVDLEPPPRLPPNL